MSEQLKQWYAEHGICINCGHREAEPGKKRCYECSVKNADYCRERYYLHREDEIKGAVERKRQLREERNAQGLCTECGKHPQYHGTKMCWICRNKHQIQDKRRHEREGRLPQELRGNGLFCYQCCKPLCNGESLCEDCRKRSAESIAYARQFIDKSNRPFQMLNNMQFGTAHRERNKE